MNKNQIINNFKVTRVKSYTEIDWLKDVHIAMVNKYWMPLTDDMLDVITIGQELMNPDQEIVGTVADINTDNMLFLVELNKSVNYVSLIDAGIHFQNIIFDHGNLFGLCDPLFDTNKKLLN